MVLICSRRMALILDRGKKEDKKINLGLARLDTRIYGCIKKVVPYFNYQAFIF